MKVICKDTIKDIERRFLGLNGFDLKGKELKVYGIIFDKKEITYLLEIDDLLLKRYDAKFFKVIDNSIPDNWIYRYYDNTKIKNMLYNWNFTISSFIGQKEFVENDNFIFELYENPSKISQILYDIKKQ